MLSGNDIWSVAADVLVALSKAGALANGAPKFGMERSVTYVRPSLAADGDPIVDFYKSEA